jgi:hypothetical protein
MQQTYRQVISDLSNDIKALNVDDRYSYRYLASKFNDAIQVFLRQDGRSREFTTETNNWKPIDCIELESVDSIKCCGVEGEIIKKSIEKIPETFSTNYGNLIKIFTIDLQTEFKQIKSQEYKEFSTREYGVSNYFWIENGFVYIPKVTFKAVKGLVIPRNQLEVDILNKEKTVCTNPLDVEITYPSYLITIAKQEVIKILFGSTLQKVVDEKPNLNSNEK